MKQGIDVSYCQENFNFNEAVNQGKEFCIIRLGRTRSDGEQELDDFFAVNYAGAMAAGMLVGVYFYSKATTVEMAEQEARFVIDTIQQQGIVLSLDTIWLDAEDKGTMGQCDNDTLTAICSKFITTLNDAGYKAGIYAGYDWLTNKINTNGLADYVPYYVANYGSTNYFKEENPGKTVLFWQYSENGNIGGVDVDLDVMYEDGE